MFHPFCETLNVKDGGIGRKIYVYRALPELDNLNPINPLTNLAYSWKENSIIDPAERMHVLLMCTHTTFCHTNDGLNIMRGVVGRKSGIAINF